MLKKGTKGTRDQGTEGGGWGWGEGGAGSRERRARDWKLEYRSQETADENV